MWDPETGKLLRRFPGPDFKARALAFSDDGKHVACVGASPEVRLYDVDTGVERARLESGCEELSFVRFLPGDRAIAVGGGSQPCILDVGSGERLHGPFDGAIYDACDLSRDGSVLAVANGSGPVESGGVDAGVRHGHFQGAMEERRVDARPR